MPRNADLYRLINQIVDVSSNLDAEIVAREIGGYQFKDKRGFLNLVPRVGIVKHVDIDNWQVRVLRIGTKNLEAVNITADSGGSYNFNGYIPEVGDFCVYVKTLANSMTFANSVVLKFLPAQAVNSEDYKLLDSWIPGFPLHPFKPILIPGNQINSSSQGSSITLTDNIDLISRDSQRMWFDSIAHQSFLFTPHYTQAGGGLLKFQGGILLNAYTDEGDPEDNAVKLKDGRYLNYYVTSSSDKYIKFNGSSDETASLTEDSSLLYEYGDYLHPVTDLENVFNYEPVNSSDGYKGLKYLYGSGTFRELLGDNKNKILKTVLFKDEDKSDDADKFNLDITFSEVDTENINTESLAYWQIIETNIDDTIDRKFTSMDKYGRMFINLGIDEGDTALKRSLDMVTEGGLKLNIGADDEDHSLHALFHGQSHLRVATDSNSNDIKFTSKDVNIQFDDDDNYFLDFKNDTDANEKLFQVKFDSTVNMRFKKTVSGGEFVVQFGDTGNTLTINGTDGSFEYKQSATNHIKLDSAGNAIFNNGSQVTQAAARTGDVVESNLVIDPAFWAALIAHTHPQSPTGPGSPSPTIPTSIKCKITHGSSNTFIGGESTTNGPAYSPA